MLLCCAVVHSAARGSTVAWPPQLHAPGRGRAGHLEPPGNDTARHLACTQRAETEIARAPDKDADRVTTTHDFKREVVRFFCARKPERLTALELGIFKGHSTAVWASMFAKVISVDVNPEYTHAAAKHSPHRKNIVFMAFDTYLTEWSSLSAIRVDVAIIDADHQYDKVRADAANVLHTFPDVRWLVFDDYATEVDVQRAVTELQEEKALIHCQPIGRGRDGRPWEMKGFKSYEGPEGMLCERGPGSPHKNAAFVDVAYILYTIPTDMLVRASGVMSFRPNGTVWSSHFGPGAWRRPEVAQARDALFLRMPDLPPASDGVWEVLFNRGRSSFVVSPEGSIETKWFGIRADKISQVFKIENEMF